MLVFVFGGGRRRRLIPIILGVMAIAIALGAAALFGLGFDLPFFIANIITMIGLAVGIDYSLFIVSRYREERADGLDELDAIARTGATASRAVLFSGLTVVVALAGMLLLPNTIYRSIGLGAILVVVVAVARLADPAAGRAGAARRQDRVAADPAAGGSPSDRGRVLGSDRPHRHGPARRQPGRSPPASCCWRRCPYFSINEGFSGVSTLPDEAESKQAFLVVESEFSGGLGSPVEIVVDGRDHAAGDRPPSTTCRRRWPPTPRSARSTVELSEAGDLALVSAPLDR